MNTIPATSTSSTPKVFCTSRHCGSSNCASISRVLMNMVFVERPRRGFGVTTNSTALLHRCPFQSLPQKPKRRAYRKLAYDLERGGLTNLFSEEMVSESKFLQPVVLPPMNGLYNWVHHFQLPDQGRGCLSFTADTSNDVHVAISAQPESMDPMYEIVVGGWGNTTSVMRRRSQGPCLCKVLVGLKKPVPDAVNNLWVSIDKKSQLIQVGRGTQPHLESVFCIYKDSQFLWDAQYICFTTWDAPATYSNIKVSAME